MSAVATEFPSDWRVIPIEQCTSAIIDYRGKSPQKTSQGIPLITAKIVKDGRVLEPSEFIADEDYATWMRRGLPKAGDVLVTTEAPLGEIAQLDGRKVALAQRLIALRGNPDILDCRFLKFAMLSRYVQDQLRARATGTTVHGIRQRELRMVKLPVPPVAEQRLIAGVLAPLHDKIELNHRMNRTLDEIAGALFRSWFIDYDPVYAKVDGRWKRGENLPGMPAHMWDIWPSELEESAIGEVPKGWPIRELQEVAEITQGSTPSTSIGEYWAPAELNWVTVKDLSEANSHVLVRTERRLSRAGVDRIGSEIVPAGTVLLSTGAPIGYTAITETPTALGTRVAAIRARSGGGNQFLIRWIQANSEALRDAANGTTFPQLLLGTLRELPIAAPGESILQAFETSLAPCHRLVAANEFENSTLGALHDVLLPKLLSGEIRVPIDGKA